MSSSADSPAAAAAAQSNLSASQETSALHNPFKLGQFSLKHRIVLSPLSRMRSYGRLPQPSHASLYYAQRTTPGGFLIAEAASVSEDAGGFPNMPGIWSEEQVEAWKPIVKAVHDKGGVFFLQLWHPGRATHVAFTRDGEPPVSSTNRTVVNGGVPQPDGKELPFSKPRALETHEIPELVGQFRRAARNAIRAGFDGVEVHGAHGYLIDQFLKDGINDRSDEYGGSVANRARFALEVVTAVCHEIGADKVGLKVSLLPDRMDSVDSDPLSLGLYLAKELSELNILYLHVVERPLVEPAPLQAHPEEPLSFRPIRDVFKGAFLSASCHSRETGIQAVRSGDADLVVYGRWFVANPDLVERFRRNLPLNQYNNHTLYTSDPVVGYTDYPFLEES